MFKFYSLVRLCAGDNAVQVVTALCLKATADTLSKVAQPWSKRYKDIVISGATANHLPAGELHQKWSNFFSDFHLNVFRILTPIHTTFL